MEEIPVKRMAALGCRLPDRLPRGEILCDITQNKWRLGDAIGCGGFGDVYLGSLPFWKIIFPQLPFCVSVRKIIALFGNFEHMCDNSIEQFKEIYI